MVVGSAGVFARRDARLHWRGCLTMAEVAAYLRVSSASQTAKSQQDAITRAARARGDRVTQWFRETAWAGTLSRPELDALREGVRGGEFRRVYVTALDRLTRSGIRDTLQVLDEFKAHGCEIVSLQDGFDVHGPMGEVVAAVMAWAAKQELRRIGERISAAKVRIESRGGHWGRPKRGDARIIERVKKLKSEGRTIRQIAATVKVPRSTVAAMVSEKGAYAPKPDRPKKGLRKTTLPPAAE